MNYAPSRKRQEALLAELSNAKKRDISLIQWVSKAVLYTVSIFHKEFPSRANEVGRGSARFKLITALAWYRLNRP